MSDATIKKTERASVTLAVHVNGNPSPTGKVKLYRDKVLLKTFKLTGAMDGALGHQAATARQGQVQDLGQVPGQLLDEGVRVAEGGPQGCPMTH